MCVDTAVTTTSWWAFARPRNFHRVAIRYLRRATDLEDIGDSDCVLGALALGRDDGNGRPRHVGYVGGVLWLVVDSDVKFGVENIASRKGSVA